MEQPPKPIALICPHCNYDATHMLTDEHIKAIGKPPKPGQIWVCIDCVDLSKFDEACDLRPLNDDDLAGLDLITIQRARAMVMSFRDLFLALSEHARRGNND